MADKEVITSWETTLSKSRFLHERSIPFLATKAETLTEAAAILRAAVVTRRTPKRNHRTQRVMVPTKQYERLTDAIEREASWMEARASNG